MQLPAPVRAAIGLAASAADQARHLPDRAIELPMLAVSTALQMSLRAQQRYAALTARGDEVLKRAPSDDPPPWATFDEPLEELAAAPDRGGYTDSRRAAQILDEILGTAGIAHDPDRHDEDGDHAEGIEPPTPITAARSAPAKRAARKAAPRKAAPPAPGKGKQVSKPRNTRPSKFDDAPE